MNRISSDIFIIRITPLKNEKQHPGVFIDKRLFGLDKTPENKDCIKITDRNLDHGLSILVSSYDYLKGESFQGCCIFFPESVVDEYDARHACICCLETQNFHT